MPHPVSLKTNQSMHWLYDTLANDYWAKAIDTAEAKRTFLIGGYYSKNLTSNWKVIVLNTNAGYKSNFWCAYDPVDSDGQLAWLIEELYDAEKNGVYVTILGMHSNLLVLDTVRHRETQRDRGRVRESEGERDRQTTD